jgi:hypothetical protein
MRAAQGGPYLQSALLCEKVLDEKDGVLSAIRIVDRVTQTVVGASPSAQVPATTLNLVALLGLKSGEARGRHTLKIVLEHPSGLKGPELSQSVLFEGEDRGQNVIIPLALELSAEGLYWFDVYLEDTLLTRMPLRMVPQYVHKSTGGGTA